MDEVDAVCLQFQILRENSHLEIQYSIIECYKHSFERMIVYLNYDDDKKIDVMTEREKFEDIVEDSLPKSSSWNLIPSYTEYKVNAKQFDHSNIVDIVLKGKTNAE